MKLVNMMFQEINETISEREKKQKKDKEQRDRFVALDGELEFMYFWYFISNNS